MVYKMKSTKQDSIRKYMEALDSFENVNSYFKKLALHLHPDKNCHPLAEQVFKKVKEIYDTVKASYKMRSQFSK